MLLELLEKHWIRVERIGLDAEKRGEAIGVEPSWEDGEMIKRSKAAAKALDKARQPRKTKAKG
ncbi:hypothetical protein EFQ99_25190 [Rhizobium vallis]|uniref:Uncharacterized protein n=1 Tax=Rhizobium vallis TaxID=634290 RepID=A0A432PEC0_9HYPH|nr:hypothetical protein [Rhizobium vallis]RUM22191.1 hypothetical protein EFQ99_25190 [Rhizobium vallis]